MPDWSRYYSSKNAEGYQDPTASGAFDRIEKEPREEDKVKKLVHTIKNVAELSGFEIINRIELKDKETGKIYR